MLQVKLSNQNVLLLWSCSAGKSSKKDWARFTSFGKSFNRFTEDKKQFLNVDFVLRLFRRISDDESFLLGLNPKWCRPDWLICQVLPYLVRPSRQSNNTRSEDDITHKLIDILKITQSLEKKVRW